MVKTWPINAQTGCFTIRVCVELGKAFEGEAVSHLGARERDVALFRAQAELGISVDGAVKRQLSSTNDSLQCEPDECVHFLYRRLDFVVGIRRRDPELQNKAVDLVHHQSHRYFLLQSVPDDCFCV